MFFFASCVTNGLTQTTLPGEFPMQIRIAERAFNGD